MSYALSAFLVPQNQILRFPGCGDDALLGKCLSTARERLADLDEQMVDEDDEEDISHEQALRELFSGDITAKFYGARYGWAFQTLCDCLGTSLPNLGFSPCEVEWYMQLDENLAKSNVALSFYGLVSDCPIDIPLSDDWPMIGHWSHEQIAESAQSIAQLATDESDPDIAEALTTVTDWFSVAAGHPNLMIVGFHG